MPSFFVVNLMDSHSQSYDLAAEDVRAAFNSDLTQVTFRLPDKSTCGHLHPASYGPWAQQ